MDSTYGETLDNMRADAYDKQLREDLVKALEAERMAHQAAHQRFQETHQKLQMHRTALNFCLPFLEELEQRQSKNGDEPADELIEAISRVRILQSQ